MKFDKYQDLINDAKRCRSFEEFWNSDLGEKYGYGKMLLIKRLFKNINDNKSILTTSDAGEFYKYPILYPIVRGGKYIGIDTRKFSVEVQNYIRQHKSVFKKGTKYSKALIMMYGKDFSDILIKLKNLNVKKLSHKFYKKQHKVKGGVEVKFVESTNTIKKSTFNKYFKYYYALWCSNRIYRNNGIWVQVMDNGKLKPVLPKFQKMMSSKEWANEFKRYFFKKQKHIYYSIKCTRGRERKAYNVLRKKLFKAGFHKLAKPMYPRLVELNLFTKKKVRRKVFSGWILVKIRRKGGKPVLQFIRGLSGMRIIVEPIFEYELSTIFERMKKDLTLKKLEREQKIIKMKQLELPKTGDNIQMGSLSTIVKGVDNKTITLSLEMFGRKLETKLNKQNLTERNTQ